MKYPTNLSERIRPDCESAPWVCAEVRLMEQQRDELLALVPRLVAVIDDMMRSTRGNLVVQNYGELNASLCDARALLAQAKP